jgi:hypothetical protein
MKIIKSILIGSFFLLISNSAQSQSAKELIPDFSSEYNNLYPYTDNNQDLERDYYYSLPEEFYFKEFNKVTVKSVDRRRSLYTNINSYKPSWILRHHYIGGKIEYIYADNNLSKIKKFIGINKVGETPSAIDFFYYTNKKLSIRENSVAINNGKEYQVDNQTIYGKGNSSDYFSLNYNYWSDNSKVSTTTIIKAISSNMRKFESFNLTNGYYSSKTIEYKNIHNKSRIVNVKKENESGIKLNSTYTYSKDGNNIIESVIDSVNSKYGMRTVYDENGRITEKGIYNRTWDNNYIKFIILNKISYNDGYTLIREYRDTYLSDESLKKNISKEFIVAKNTFNNKIDFWIMKTSDTYPPYIFLMSTIPYNLKEIELISEKVFQNGKEKFTLNYFYQKNEDIIEKIEAFYSSTDNKNTLAGLVYIYERQFE